MSRPPVLIIFANLKGNLGDIAILHSMLVALEGHHPGSEIHVSTLGHLEVDETRMAAWAKRPHPPYVLKGKTAYKRIPRPPAIIKALGLAKWWAGKEIDRLRGEFSRLEAVKAAAGYEATYLFAGEQWTGYSAGINMFAMLDAIADVNPQVFMFPFSVRASLHGFYTPERLKAQFSRLAGNLVVRDSDSADTLRPYRPDLVSGVDCVFALVGEEMSAAPPPPPETPLVLLAITVTADTDRAQSIAAIRSLLAGGFRVRLLTTCELEDGKDLAALAESLGIGFTAPATWQEVVEEYRSASVVVSNRLHCVIFTFFANVPVVPLTNREKVAGLKRDAGFTHSIATIPDLTPAKAGEWIRESGTIRGEMRGYLTKVRASRMTPWTAGNQSSGKNST